jgi:hypothetical protein
MADTLEDTIAAMMDGADPAPPPEADPEPVVEAEPAEEPVLEGEEPAEEPAEPQEGRDEHGRFKAAPKDAPAKTLAKPGDPPPAAEPPKALEPPKAPYRPPQSWKPDVHAALAKADPAIQAEAARLDREYRGIMAQNAEIRKQHGEATQFRQQVEAVVSPFAGIFAAEGVQPLQGVANVVQTYGQLHFGAPQDKARILAGLIGRFSTVDDVNAVLTGQTPAAAPPQYRPPAPHQPPVDVRAVVAEQFNALREQAASTRAQRDWSAFAATKPEHLDLLLPSMRAMVRAWAIENQEAEQEGQAPPYPTDASVYKLAYDTARQHNPQLRAWDEQTKAAEVARASAAKAKQARAAGSSVRSSPTSSGSGRKLSLHEEIEAQWNEHEGR